MAMTKQQNYRFLPGTLRQARIHLLWLLIYGAVFFCMCCNSDECQKNADCNEDSYCVQGECRLLSADTRNNSNSSAGGGSLPGAATNSTDDDTAQSTGDTLSDDTVQTALDTSYGIPFDPNSKELQSLDVFGCVNYYDDYYSCELTDFVALGMCDLINVNGCSSILFPEACMFTFTSDFDIISNSICFSPLQGAVEEAPDIKCVEAGGNWLPCPF